MCVRDVNAYAVVEIARSLVVPTTYVVKVAGMRYVSYDMRHSDDLIVVSMLYDKCLGTRIMGHSLRLGGFVVGYAVGVWCTWYA